MLIMKDSICCWHTERTTTLRGIYNLLAFSLGLFFLKIPTNLKSRDNIRNNSSKVTFYRHVLRCFMFYIYTRHLGNAVLLSSYLLRCKETNHLTMAVEEISLSSIQNINAWHSGIDSRCNVSVMIVVPGCVFCIRGCASSNNGCR